MTERGRQIDSLVSDIDIEHGLCRLNNPVVHLFEVDNVVGLDSPLDVLVTDPSLLFIN